MLGSVTGLGTLLAVAIPFSDDPQRVETVSASDRPAA